MIDVEKFVGVMKSAEVLRWEADMWDFMNVRSDKFFFAWGGGTMSHALVLLIEDDCAA